MVRDYSQVSLNIIALADAGFLHWNGLSFHRGGAEPRGYREVYRTEFELCLFIAQ